MIASGARRALSQGAFAVSSFDTTMDIPEPPFANGAPRKTGTPVLLHGSPHRLCFSVPSGAARLLESTIGAYRSEFNAWPRVSIIPIHDANYSRLVVLPSLLKTYRLEHLRISLSCGNRFKYCLSQSNFEHCSRLHIRWLTRLCRLKTFVERGIRDVKCFTRVETTGVSCHCFFAAVHSLISVQGALARLLVVSGTSLVVPDSPRSFAAVAHGSLPPH